MTVKKFKPILILTAAMIVIQLIVSLIGTEFYLTQLTMALYYSLIIISLCIFIGYAGQISLGHAAFFAIGGYTTAVLTTTNFKEYIGSGLIKLIHGIGLTSTTIDPYGKEILHLSPWLALFTAIVITIIIALIIGIPVLKLKGHYMAMATLGFGLIIYRILLGSKIFGQADGISNVPAFIMPFGLKICGDSSLRLENYYIAGFIVLLGIIILYNLIHSRAGRALRAIHGSEEAAGAAGINTAKYKLFVFVLSAVFACISGVFLTHFFGGIGPAEAGVMKSVRYVALVAVGGMANIWGTLGMSLILNFLSLRGVFGSYDDAFFGSILILFILVFPDGILKAENFTRMKEFFKYFFKKKSEKVSKT